MKGHVDNTEYVVRSGENRGLRAKIIQPQELVPGRVNTGDLPCGVELEDGRRLSLPRDWLVQASSRLARQVIKNAATGFAHQDRAVTRDSRDIGWPLAQLVRLSKTSIGVVRAKLAAGERYCSRCSAWKAGSEWWPSMPAPKPCKTCATALINDRKARQVIRNVAKRKAGAA